MKQKQRVGRHEIVIIGAGNLATHLAKALIHAGHVIRAIYSRSPASAETLAESIGANIPVVHHLQDIPDASIYLIAVTDTALPQIATCWPKHRRKGIVAHMAGAVPMDVLKTCGSGHGVFYPLQTFSKKREVAFSNIPCFIEGNTAEASSVLEELAASVSTSVHVLDSRRRKCLHLAAVFACNFVNHLYHLSSTLLEDEGLDPRWLNPLIEETAQKIKSLSPQQAQTGPAVRGDQAVMQQHLEQLSTYPELQSLYEYLSRSIYKTFHQ